MKKRAVIGALSAFLALAVICFVVYMVFYHQNDKDAKSMTPYEQSLSEPVTYDMWDDTWADIENSDAVYLQDPDFDVTTNNFQQCFADFLSAPARLYFYDSSVDANTSYKCDAPKIRVKFADAFQDVNLEDCSEETYSSLPSAFTDQPITEIGFHNVTGYVVVSLYEGHSYIFYSRYFVKTDSYQLHYFYTKQDLTASLTAAYDEVMDYSMKAPASETE